MPSSSITFLRSSLAVGAELLVQGEAVVVDVGDDDVARPVVAADGGSHAADGAGSGDEHVLAHHVEGERGVRGVAVGVEDRGDVVRDRGVDSPYVGGRDGNVLGEAAGAVDADSHRVGAEVALARFAGAALAADDVPLGRHALADLPADDFLAELHDLADELVADGHGCLDRALGPGVPFVDVDIGAADGGFLYLDKNVLGPYRGHGDVVHPNTRLGSQLDEGFHEVLLFAESITLKARAGKDCIVAHSLLMMPICPSYSVFLIRKPRCIVASTSFVILRKNCAARRNAAAAT
jgi:hypothetical protein